VWAGIHCSFTVLTNPSGKDVGFTSHQERNKLSRSYPERVSINQSSCCKKQMLAGSQWLTSVILDSCSEGRGQEDHSSWPAGQIVHETLSRKYPSQKGLAEWLKVKTLSSSPSNAQRKERKQILTLTDGMESLLF
jgi:hypothetical protein